MKKLVVFYSRTGNNRKIAGEIAKAMKADIDEIIDKKNREGKLNWLRAGRDSMGLKTTDIEFKKNPKDYDLIVLCTPIWAGNLTPAMRSYLKEHNMKGKKVAFSICSGGPEKQAALSEMRQLTKGSKVVAELGLTEKQFKEGGYKELIADFVRKLA